MPIRSLAAAAALACLAPAAALAQHAAPAAVAADDDAQLALATVLTNDGFVAETFRQSMDTAFVSALHADPAMAEIEAECPGLIAAMSEAVEPVMWPSHQRDHAGYRADLHTLFEGELSDAHAREAAEFFASPLGQRFMAALTNAMTVDAMLGELEADETAHISAQAMAADNLESASRGIMALEPADRLEITTVFATSAWAAEFNRLQPQIDALQLAMANADFSAEEGAAMDAAIDGVLEERLAACFPDETEQE